MIDEIKTIILNFLEEAKNLKFINIYNEFSLQHELGIYLRENLKANYKIEFERNISFFSENINKKKFTKKEIDIVVYSEDKTEKYAIEIKHPLNGQHPEQMFSFIKDLKFLEELKEIQFTNTISLVLVKDKLFYDGKEKTGIYKFFRNNQILKGEIEKPTGTNKSSINLKNQYVIKWHELTNGYKYYLIES